MRILVGLHHLELGGSQLNALDLALEMRERGHEIVAFGVHDGEPGMLAQLVLDAGLPLALAEHPRVRQGKVPVRWAVARQLTVAAADVDLVHTYEYALHLDAFFGPHLRYGVPLVQTTYAMTVPRWLPRRPPLVVGTHALVESAAPFRVTPPTLIEPPVNTRTDDPAVVDGTAFRTAHGIETDDLVLGIVSRLEPDMKAEGVDRAMEAVRLVAGVRLVVTGDGPSYDALREHAEKVNADLGRRAVIMTGALADPRPAYAAADIALGMGGSALRSMAFGKPLIVLGVRGFAKPYGPETAAEFLAGGFFGIGDGDLAAGPLAGHIRRLAGDVRLRRELGELSRRTVLERFSLIAAADVLDDVYRRAVAIRPRRARDALRVAAHYTTSEFLPEGLKRRIRP